MQLYIKRGETYFWTTDKCDICGKNKAVRKYRDKIDDMITYTCDKCGEKHEEEFKHRF